MKKLLLVLLSFSSIILAFPNHWGLASAKDLKIAQRLARDSGHRCYSEGTERRGSAALKWFRRKDSSKRGLQPRGTDTRDSRPGESFHCRETLS
jgi:hypothetical protein